MATIMDTISDMLRETIAQGAEEILPKLDPLVGSLVGTSRGVESRSVNSGFGRAWQVQHRFIAGEAGAHAWRSAAGGDVALAGTNNNSPFTLYGTNALQRWQNVNEIASPGYGNKTITLKEGFGNFLIPLHLKRAEKLTASVTSETLDIARGAAKRQAASLIHSFWKTTSTNAIGGFTSGSSQTINYASPLTVTLTSGRIRSFFPGLAVQVFVASDGSTPTGFTAGEPVWVDSVNYLAKTLKLRRARSGVSTITLANSTAYIILPYDGVSTAASQSVSPSGLDDWIKDGTETDPTVFGVNVNTYPTFRSIKATGLSGILDSATLNKHIGGFEDGYGMELDTLVMTWGTMLGLQDTVLGGGTSLVRYDLNGEAAQIKYGFMPFAYLFNGRPFKIYISANCPIGTVYVLNTGDNNIQKYLPPRLDKAGTRTGFNGDCEFVGRVLGYADDFIPVSSNDAPTNFLQCPYLNWCEIAPRMVQGIKLGTFTENIYTG